jgi:hypothetical protein
LAADALPFASANARATTGLYPGETPRVWHGRDRGPGSTFFPKPKGAIVFVELDTREDAGYIVSLEWDRDTDNTQIVIADSRTADLLVFLVPSENAGDAFRDPFRYAP